MDVKHRDQISILRRAIELEVEGRRPVGRSTKIGSKVVNKEISKLNITEYMAGEATRVRPEDSETTDIN